MTDSIITQMCDVCDETKKELENIRHSDQSMTEDQVIAFFRGLQLLAEPQSYLTGPRTTRIITQMCDACDKTKKELENVRHLDQSMTEDQVIAFFRGYPLLAEPPNPSFLALFLKLL